MKPSDAEIDANPRSQSAVMRVARRLPFPETVFFFQAEDGIRGIGVTGVQTCALPIFGGPATNGTPTGPAGPVGPMGPRFPVEIGRASCRERVYISVVAVSLKKKIRNKRKLSTMNTNNRNRTLRKFTTETKI